MKRPSTGTRDQPGPDEATTQGLGRRLLWFAALWAGGVLVLAIVVALLRTAMRP